MWKTPTGRRVDTKKTELLFKGSLYIYKKDELVDANLDFLAMIKFLQVKKVIWENRKQIGAKVWECRSFTRKKVNLHQRRDFVSALLDRLLPRVICEMYNIFNLKTVPKLDSFRVKLVNFQGEKGRFGCL